MSSIRGASNQLESLLRAAMLAPSSHNTQPWIFKLSDGRLSLLADRTRALPANDPNDRELTISCGCALLNLRVAAAGAGIAAKVRVLPDHESDDVLAIIDLEESPGASKQEADLSSEIPNRRTYRKRFKTKPVPDSILTALCTAAEEESTWFKVLSEERMRQETAKLVAEGDAIQWANPSWRRELAAWMHPRRKGDGLTVPGIVAPVAQVVVRTFDMGNGVGAKDSELAEGSPILAVLGTPGDTPLDWLNAGQGLERLLLTACRYGLQASYLNQPVQVASLRSKLKQVIGELSFPQIVLRIGFPVDDVQAAPRRNLNDVCSNAPGLSD